MLLFVVLNTGYDYSMAIGSPTPEYHVVDTSRRPTDTFNKQGGVTLRYMGSVVLPNEMKYYNK